MTGLGLQPVDLPGNDCETTCLPIELQSDCLQGGLPVPTGVVSERAIGRPATIQWTGMCAHELLAVSFPGVEIFG